jgi:hypothetical protein
VLSEPHVDLWYHGLAVVGFGENADVDIYNPGYLERVRRIKEELGVYPTSLDRAAEEMKEGLDADRVFQNLHFLPLYFPTATPEQMLRGLNAITNQDASDSGAAASETGGGLGFAVAAFANEDQRRTLGRFVRALEEEWTSFFQDYWSDSLAVGEELQGQIQTGWDENVAGPLDEFLGRHDLDSGRIFVSAVLGPVGRSVEQDRERGRENAVAVWTQSGVDPTISVSAAVREMCMALVDGRVVNVGTRSGRSPMSVVGSASARCGALLFEKHNPDFLTSYQRAFLSAAGEATTEAELASDFEDAFPINSGVMDILRSDIDPAVGRAAESRQPRWSVRSRPQVDLWYHGLATIGAEREELVPPYNRDYAEEIRQAKRERGVAATRLDSLTDYFRSEFGSKRELQFFDQLPLYFQDATPEQMLTALRAVADRQVYRRDKVSPEALAGAAVVAQIFTRANLRRVLKRYVEALEEEWQIFYREYWDQTTAANSGRRSDLDEFWATSVAPRLDDFLAERWLDAGTILVSPAVGPDGRLFIGDPDNREDNQVVVWSPTGSSSRQPAYHVIKEVCHSVVTAALDELVDENRQTRPLRMTAAVRCGALVLDKYAPILSAGYRRAMMEGVGVAGSATVRRFEQQFALEPEILTALIDEIGR